MAARHLVFGLALLAVPALTILPDSASGQDALEPFCGEFEAVRHQDLITFINHGNEGVSPGDVRILRWQLVDQDGEPIGVQHATSRVMHSDTEGSFPLMGASTFLFDNGILMASAFVESRDPSDTGTSSVRPLEWFVYGGTGEFAGATGSIVTTPTGDGVYDIAFDLSCSE